MGIPALKERFLAPAGWHTYSFASPATGHKIHCGSVFPDPSKPLLGTVIILPGLSEFTEKYFETMRDMLNRGYAVWALDWQYQGRSGRLPQFPQRRHSDGFETDVADLHHMIETFVKPSSQSLPLVFLGHSLGGHIGLRYLVTHPGQIQAAAFSAPFLGIYALSPAQKILSIVVRPFLNVVGQSYVPGGSDFNETIRNSFSSKIFSSDPIRNTLQNAWMRTEPVLQVGQPTFRWVIEALDSCAYLKSAGVLEKIDIPLLFGVAGQEHIVDNHSIREAAKRITKASLAEIQEAHHEILMEKDELRDMFLTRFDKLIKFHHI
jgi:lysophospholipase